MVFGVDPGVQLKDLPRCVAPPASCCVLPPESPWAWPSASWGLWTWVALSDLTPKWGSCRSISAVFSALICKHCDSKQQSGANGI